MAEHHDRILIVDDNEVFGRSLQQILERRFDVDWVGSRDAARNALQDQPYHGILLDVRLGGEESGDTDGILLLAEIRQERPLLPVVIMTAVGSVRLAVDAMKLGADDFIEKGGAEPGKVVQVLVDVVRRRRDQLKLEACAAEQTAREPFDMVGNASAIEPLRKSIEIAAQDGHCSVLVCGETGTGKEVVSRAIHQLGWRHQGPFVAVSVVGLSASLLESELFGHEKGAFTGAIDRHIGYLERAEGGVLFLDEIGDLSPELQVKLLRFLEDRVVRRVGSSRDIRVDVQLVSATHQPLADLVAQGKFRQDLYYRLRTVELRVPPLRDRLEDISLLADHFLQLLRRQGRTKLVGFGGRAMRALEQYSYPGNVRQLRAAVEWAVLAAAHAGHSAVEYEDLPVEFCEPQVRGPNLSAPGAANTLNVEEARARAEMACVDRALTLCRGHKSEAEQMLGYPNRHTMRRRIHQLRQKFPDAWNEFAFLKQAYADEMDGNP